MTYSAVVFFSLSGALLALMFSVSVRVNEFASNPLLACTHRKLIFVPRRANIIGLCVHIDVLSTSEQQQR